VRTHKYCGGPRVAPAGCERVILAQKLDLPHPDCGTGGTDFSPCGMRAAQAEACATMWEHFKPGSRLGTWEDF